MEREDYIITNTQVSPIGTAQIIERVNKLLLENYIPQKYLFLSELKRINRSLSIRSTAVYTVLLDTKYLRAFFIPQELYEKRSKTYYTKVLSVYKRYIARKIEIDYHDARGSSQITSAKKYMAVCNSIFEKILKANNLN